MDTDDNGAYEDAQSLWLEVTGMSVNKDVELFSITYVMKPVWHRSKALTIRDIFNITSSIQ